MTDTTVQLTADPTAVLALDPRTLLVDLNVRTDTTTDRVLVDSIRDRGVIVPIVAVRTADGHARVRAGHRRTQAAIAARLVTVPVVVVADEATGDAGSVERLLDQWAENEHRTPLATADRVSAVGQLAAFGLSPTQIVRRTRARRAEVDAALAVTASDLARAATARYHLTIDQAAAVAEFDDDTDTVKALVAAVRSGQFDHVLQRARDARTTADEREAMAVACRDAGVRVLDEVGIGRRLSALADQAGRALDPNAHRACPGHAVHPTQEWTDQAADADSPGQDDEEEYEDGDQDDEQEGDDPDPDAGRYRPLRVHLMWTATAYCLDPEANGHRGRWGRTTSDGSAGTPLTDTQRAAAAADRRAVIDNNRSWRSAEKVRRTWLRAFATRKTPPKGSARWIALTLAHGDHGVRRAMEDGHALARDLLTGDTTGPAHGRLHPVLADALTGASDARAAVISLFLLLSAHEQGTGTHSWRNLNAATGRYLTCLAELGYGLSEIEQKAAGQDPLPHPRPTGDTTD